ncbi:MAG TPA: hypothetical protein PK765_00950 [bacterium]|nr:hypothetical protein [bacterium]
MSDASNLERIAALESENAELRRKLEFSRAWMRKQVEEQVHQISLRKTRMLASESRDDFFREQQEQMISTHIRRYFGEEGAVRLSDRALSLLVQSEIAYYALTKNPALDGLSVVGVYQKLLDDLVERGITEAYRTRAREDRLWLTANDPVEKALHLVVTKNYILSLGRLYSLLKTAKNDDASRLPAFTQAFVHHIRTDERFCLLLEKPFYPLFAQLIASQAMGEKRHRGNITLEETRRAREWTIASFSPGAPSVVSGLLAITSQTERKKFAQEPNLDILSAAPL